MKQNNRQEVILPKLSDAVQEKHRLSDVCERDKWETITYETASVCGVGLVAYPNTMPLPITLDLNVEGWYKIYLCMPNLGGNDHFEIKLSNDEFSRVIGPGNVQSYVQWHAYEKVDEFYWKSADLTGQNLTIAKPDDGSSYCAGLMWIRLVPMEDKEVDTYLYRQKDASGKTMYAHMDEDYNYLDDPSIQNEHDFCRHLYHMKDSDVKIVAQEVTNDLADLPGLELKSYVGRNARNDETWGIRRIKRFKETCEKREAILKEEIAYVHKHRMQFFAVQRPSLSSFAFPLTSRWNRIPFVEEHPEFMCRTRNGKQVRFLSYAYEEVQNYMIENLTRYVRWGVDGLTLLFTRGVCVLFEKPVLERFSSKFGNEIDMRKLPGDDPRVTEIKGDIMTDFMGKLRRRLDAVTAEEKRDPVKLYITAYCSAEESKHDGIDVERFARAGLIDGVIQSNMTVWEDTDDVRDEQNLIDLEKYTRKAETEYVVNRAYGNELERILSGLSEYNRIARENDIQLYTEIQWENSAQPQEFAEYAKQIYQYSKGCIALWDCYPARVVRMPEWYCTSRLGSVSHIEELLNSKEIYRKVHKVLAYNGTDISLYNPSWRG